MKKIISLALCFFLIAGTVGCSANTTGSDQQNASSLASNEEAFQNVSEKKSGSGPIALTFVTSYGETIETKNIQSGDAPDLSDVTAPDISGLSFARWYLDQACTEPYVAGTTFLSDTTLYAGYRSTGANLSVYYENQPVDTSFELYSMYAVNIDTLKNYIQFDDIYDGSASLTMKALEETPDLSEEDLSAYADTVIDKAKLKGTYRYQLSAENGFVPGGLYSITSLHPQTAFLISMNGQSLTGNAATAINFRIAMEKVDDRQENANVIHLENDVCKDRNIGSDDKGTITMDASVQLKTGDVFHLPSIDGTGDGSYYKVVSASKVGSRIVYQVEAPATDDVWDSYELDIDSSDIISSELITADDLDPVAMADEINSSLGFAAYVDAVLDGVKKSPEVQAHLATVSAEDYNRVMNLSAVDLGVGPKELRPTQNESQTKDDEGNDLGGLSYEFLYDANKIVNGMKLTFSKDFDFDIGKAASNGLKGKVSIGISISEACSFVVYSRMKKLNTAKYPSMTETWTRTGVIPTTETEVNVTASLSLDKDEKETDSHDQFALELGLDNTNAPEGTQTISLASQSYDLWKYVSIMKEKMDDDEDLYDMDMDYVDLYDKEFGQTRLTVTGIDSGELVFHFKFQLAAQLNLQADLNYKYTCDCYTTNGLETYSGGKVVDIVNFAEDDTRCKGKQVLQSDLDLTIAVQGGIGLAAQLGIEINFSGFQLNDIASVGLEADVGPYIEFKGFFKFDYDTSFVDTSDRGGGVESYSTASFKGGAQVEIGIKLDISAKLTVIHTWNIGIYSNKWPIFSHVLGAWSSNHGVYAGFVDDAETLEMDGNQSTALEISTMAADQTTVTAKHRSTESSTAYDLETTIGDKKSSGLLVLKGNTDDASVAAVTLTNVNLYPYTYELTGVTRKDADGRGYDGRIRYKKITYTKSQDISKYAVVGVDGRLNVNANCPDVTFTVKITANCDENGDDVTNVFTAEHPTKILTINYTQKSSNDQGNVQKHYINFYDTDGNLIVRDTYAAGAEPITFPAPGYTNTGTYSYVETETKKNHYEGDVTWNDIVGYYWGYNYYLNGALVTSYNYNSARWTDMPMSSGKEGSLITAASIGKMDNDVDVYLHMDYQADANWQIQYVDPDDTRKIVMQRTVKNLKVVYKNISELTDLAPTLEDLQVDGTLSGALENAGTWDIPTRTYGYTDPTNTNSWVYGGQRKMKASICRLDEIYKEDGTLQCATYDFKQSVQRSMPEAYLTVGLARAVIKSYTWGTVNFLYHGQSIGVKTNVGEIPTVPDAFAGLTDISGWSEDYASREEADIGLNYSNIMRREDTVELQPLQSDNVKPTYYACVRKGTLINARYVGAVLDSSNRYTAIKEYVMHDLKYDSLSSYAEQFNAKDFMTETADAYKFLGWKYPSKDEYESGIVPEEYAGLAKCTQGSDGRWYLNAGESYPIIAQYSLRDRASVIFNADGLGTLSGGSAVWESNVAGSMTTSLAADGSTYTVTWPTTDAYNGSTIKAPDLTGNGTVPSAYLNPYQWVWRSTEKINGEYITFAGNGRLDLYHVSIPSGTTVVFKPYITKRQVTIHLGQTDTITVEGTAGDNITGTWLYDNLTNYSKIKNIKSLLASIPNTSPLPYTLGTSTSGKAVYQDEITVPVIRYETSTIYLAGGAFSDGSDKNMSLTGPETDVIDLTSYTAVSNKGNGYSDSNGIRFKYSFVGWQADNGAFVTKIYYGEDVQAVYNMTGTYVESFTLDAGTGKFSDQSTTKTIEYDLSKKLTEQTGYEQPSHSALDFVSWKWNDDSSVFDATASPQSVYEKITKGSKHLIAFYDDNPVTVTDYTGAYDGLAHGVTAVAKQDGSTLEYADNENGPWTTTVPQLKDFGTKTVYVKAIKSGFRTSAVKSGTITITRASATVTADNKKRLITEQNPELTATVTGLVNNEPASTLNYTITRTAGEETGTYTITPSGDAVQGNYNVTYVNGTFTITTTVKLTYTLDAESVQSVGTIVYKKGSEAPTELTQPVSLQYDVTPGSAIGSASVPSIWRIYADNTSGSVPDAAVTFKVVTDAANNTTVDYTPEGLAGLNVSADTAIRISIATYTVNFAPAAADTYLDASQLVSSSVGLIAGMKLHETEIPGLYNASGTLLSPICYVDSLTGTSVFKYSKTALTNCVIGGNITYYVKQAEPDHPIVN